MPKVGETIKIYNLSVTDSGWCKSTGSSKWYVKQKLDNGRLLLKFKDKYHGYNNYYFGRASDGWCVGVTSRYDLSRYIKLDTDSDGDYIPDKITSKPGGTYYQLYKSSNYWYIGSQV
mmetsp:Transcript_24920/g.21801  ORF Transcript_24920/g.21801 Transcript_24920/m.21801 type:complete len:117 (-) Transcript_24920:197-547(-)